MMVGFHLGRASERRSCGETEMQKRNGDRN